MISKKWFIILAALLISACSSPQTMYVSTFQQNVPFLPAPVKQTLSAWNDSGDAQVCSYDSSDIMKIKKDFFPEYVIIGRSDFTGRYEYPYPSADFAHKIGAELMLTTYSNTGKTETVSVESGTASASGNVAVANSVNQTYTIAHLSQKALYLRKTSEGEHIWLRSRDSYPEDTENKSELSGRWGNNFYTLDIYPSGGKIVAITSIKAENLRNYKFYSFKEDSNVVSDYDSKHEFYWPAGIMKFEFDPQTMKGIYLRSDHCPEEAEFSVSKDGQFITVRIAGAEPYEYLQYKRLPPPEIK
ncbi:MAG: hypothetical protein J5706_08505 [Elusimicrobiales bacterium]|nr:hypothetical protein [Elusimicrobiales bacterium]